MKCSLNISVLFETSPIFHILLFPSVSLHCSFKKTFSSLLCILWNSAFSWVYLSLFPLPFASLSLIESFFLGVNWIMSLLLKILLWILIDHKVVIRLLRLACKVLHSLPSVLQTLFLTVETIANNVLSPEYGMLFRSSALCVYYLCLECLSLSCLLLNSCCPY